MGGVAPVPDNIQRQAATENAPKAEMTTKLGFVDYSQGKCAFYQEFMKCNVLVLPQSHKEHMT